ncbi:putative TRAP-type C4-dicarboxylate transport system, periplasmic component (dctP-like) [Bradyrhizobium sp. ORS 278]|uniref:TRAP transporter substrate-binding protein n=1 Tax=Bradyrhizobium sp. (strain ORS 278) TaxID=114615 RepID=UPI00015077F8|nr:TRAP transporter substrate-binding protein [Bradyrhizobium sp. ORS 278]CAL75590.1 putative TRAP-type C4-dicarboxylate transport system, periplasmic component (dctP-like) [Bradyrhizobium sp. ORS 278]
MLKVSRRALLTIAAGAAAAGYVLKTPAVLAQSAPLKLKFGNDLPAAHSVNVRLREAVDTITAETKGQVEISLFPNNQLGSDSDMMTQLRSGALELATMPGTVMSTLIPTASLTGVGFAFTSYDKVWAAMDGEVGGFIRRNIEKVGLVPFESVWDNGFRQITTSTKPINTPADLANFKIRVPVVPLWVSMFSAFGASPISVPLSEAYSALQTKIADGQENPLALIESAKFYEVQKFCSLTNHSWDGFWLLSSGKIWKTIPQDVQKLLQTTFNAAAKKQRADIVQANADLQKSLEGKGLTFNRTDAELFQATLAKTSFYKDAKAKFGDEAWSLLQRYAGNIS